MDWKNIRRDKLTEPDSVWAIGFPKWQSCLVLKMPPVEIKEVSQLECYRNSLDVCDWCGEEQASELRLLCLEQIWMRATGPSLIFQWCDCSENFLNGAAIPKILSRVRLHLAPPKVASPQGYRCTCACFPMVQLHLAPPKEMVLLLLKGATTFSCS